MTHAHLPDHVGHIAIDIGAEILSREHRTVSAVFIGTVASITARRHYAHTLALCCKHLQVLLCSTYESAAMFLRAGTKLRGLQHQPQHNIAFGVVDNSRGSSGGKCMIWQGCLQLHTLKDVPDPETALLTVFRLL